MPVSMRAGLVVFSMVLAAAGFVRDASAEEAVDAKWYLSVGAGWFDFQGDDWLRDSPMLGARVGFDAGERWTFEGVLSFAPVVNANNAGKMYFDYTQVAGLGLEALFHFTRWERLDPYLSAGVGVLFYGESKSDTVQSAFRGGGGVMWHFNDEWAVRADWVGMIRGFGDAPSSSSIMDAGIVWYWAANVPVKPVAISATKDSDGDGLSDREEEEKYHTDPYERDSDKDGLDDGQEVKVYGTDPNAKDTDLDMLNDGYEVNVSKTDPRNPDTDGGGVSDGHEVLEDGTDPRAGHGDDDLILFEMYINFDYDKATISPLYYGQLEVIARVLARTPKATAKIEGHADRLQHSDKSYNQRLSEKRARSAMEILVGKGIDAKRLEAVGYGFERPKYQNHPKDGNPLNRRVDVYIRGLDKTTKDADQAEFKAAAPSAAAGTGKTPAAGAAKKSKPKDAADK